MASVTYCLLWGWAAFEVLPIGSAATVCSIKIPFHFLPLNRRPLPPVIQHTAGTQLDWNASHPDTASRRITAHTRCYLQIPARRSERRFPSYLLYGKKNFFSTKGIWGQRKCCIYGEKYFSLAVIIKRSPWLKVGIESRTWCGQFHLCCVCISAGHCCAGWTLQN